MAIRTFWDEELSPERAEELLQKGAAQIQKRGFTEIAMMALPVLAPISNITSHAALGLTGFLAPLLGPDLFDDLTRLVSKREHLERLIEILEDKQREGR